MFEEFGLTHVEQKICGEFTTFKALNETLGELYGEVSKASIDSEEEGAVLYMVEVFKDEKKRANTLTLAKLKTLEYRLFRKIREKLKTYVSRGRGDAKVQKATERKFLNEAKGLTRSFPAFNKLSYYSDILLLSMNFIKANPGFNVEQIHNNFVNFITCMRECLAKKIQPSIKMIFTPDSIKEIIQKA